MSEQPVARIERHAGVTPDAFNPMDVVFDHKSSDDLKRRLADAPAVTAWFESDGIYVRLAPVPDDLWAEAGHAVEAGVAALSQVSAWVGQINTPFFSNDGPASAFIRFPRTDNVLVEVGLIERPERGLSALQDSLKITDWTKRHLQA